MYAAFAGRQALNDVGGKVDPTEIVSIACVKEEGKMQMLSFALQAFIFVTKRCITDGDQSAYARS